MNKLISLYVSLFILVQTAPYSTLSVVMLLGMALGGIGMLAYDLRSIRDARGALGRFPVRHQTTYSPAGRA
jgi:hypothetical protein